MQIQNVNLVVDFESLEGNRVVFDFALYLRSSGSLDRDMDEAAAKMAWAGAVLGMLYEVKEVLDSEYRTWRADEGERILAASEKLAEWKVNQLIESSVQFKDWKRRIASTNRQAKVTYGVVMALAASAEMLRSRGANLRAERRAIGMATMEAEPEDKGRSSEESDDEKRERVLVELLDQTDGR